MPLTPEQKADALIDASISDLNRRITLGELEERLKAIGCTMLSEIPPKDGSEISILFSIKVVSCQDPSNVLVHTWGGGLEMCIVDAINMAEAKVGQRT